MANRIGIIVEDKSDLDVIKEIIKKIAGNKSFEIERFFAYGCGKMEHKCLAWANNLKQKKCNSLILVRDLDQNSLPQIKQALLSALQPCPIAKNVIVIPVMEIEAWLLSDHNAISSGLKLKNKVPRIPNPESIMRPKEKLRDLIYLKSEKRKRYVNTTHNELIAKALKIDNLKRCSSFLPLGDFVSGLFKTKI